MTEIYWLKIVLKSDTIFGRGDGVAGFVDTEVQHDECGLPYLGGKTLKGLLAATCAEIRYALELSRSELLSSWDQSSERLFGFPGSREESSAILHFGDAGLPDDLREVIALDIRRKHLSRQDILETLTTLRRQTAIDAETGAPQKETLRTVRVILRETPFIARLSFVQEPGDFDLVCLAACVKALRRAGSDRNRGRGSLQAELYDSHPIVLNGDGNSPAPITDSEFAEFRKAVLS